MATKEQIIANLSTLSLAKLEKLEKYAELLIIPEEDLLLNATMRDMYDKAMELADTYFPEWTDRSESDFGRFLTELICLFSEKDFWYINAFANEAVLSKMSIYSDAFVRATELSYHPQVCKGAEATFDLVFAAGSEYTYKRGEMIVGIPNTDLLFTNDTDIVIPTSASPATIPIKLYEGNQVSENVVFNGHNIIVNRQMVDVESIDLYVNNNLWSRVRSFGQSNVNSPHYVVLPEENGSFSIYFGEDGYGIKPAVGTSMRVVYRVCKGTNGNVDLVADPIVSASVSTRPITAVEMTTDATLGANPETLASIKTSTPFYFSTKLAAINSDTLEKILLTYPEIKRANVDTLGNNVYFRVIPIDGAVADTTFLNALKTRIEPLIMLGYIPLGQPTVYVTCGPIALTVSVLSGFNVEEIRSLVKQLIEDYTNPLVLADYGDDFDLTELALLIRSKITGIQNVIFDSVAGGPPATISVAPTQIKQKVPISNITVTVNVI